MFKKGELVAKGIRIMGSVTVTFSNVVKSNKSGVIRLEDSCLDFDASNGREINSVIPGCTSFITTYEEAVKNLQAKRWKLDEGETLPDMGAIKLAKAEESKPKSKKKKNKE